MFELGVITDEIADDLERALAVCAEYGIRQAELRTVDKVNMVDASDEQLKKIKTLVERAGFQVPCIASPFLKCDLPGTKTEETGPLHAATARTMAEQMDLLQRCVKLAHLFGAKIIRGFSFWKTEATEEVLARMREAFQEPLKLMAKEGLILGLENETSCVFGTGAQTAAFVASIAHPNLRIVWDPGNAFPAGETPYPDGYQQVKPYLCHVHIKDFRRKPEGGAELAVVGEGDIDYRGQFRALVQDGYEGVVSLETHYRPASGSPEEGSRACLAGIKQILAEIASG